MKRKGEARCLRGKKKNANRDLLEWYKKKVQFSPEKYINLELIERRGDNGNEGKIGQIYIQSRDHMSVLQLGKYTQTLQTLQNNSRYSLFKRGLIIVI